VKVFFFGVFYQIFVHFSLS